MTVLPEPAIGNDGQCTLGGTDTGGPRKVVPSLALKVVPSHWRSATQGGPMPLAGDIIAGWALFDRRDLGDS
jgi:hypothetical protein